MVSRLIKTRRSKLGDFPLRISCMAGSLTHVAGHAEVLQRGSPSSRKDSPVDIGLANRALRQAKRMTT